VSLTVMLTKSSAVAERLLDASCHWIFHQLTQGHSRSLEMRISPYWYFVGTNVWFGRYVVYNFIYSKIYLHYLQRHTQKAVKLIVLSSTSVHVDSSETSLRLSPAHQSICPSADNHVIPRVIFKSINYKVRSRFAVPSSEHQTQRSVTPVYH